MGTGLGLQGDIIAAGLNEHVPVGGVSDDRSRVDKVTVKDDAPLTAVQSGHLDAVQYGVGPVHVSGHVIDGDSFRAAQICSQKQHTAFTEIQPDR